jgi:ribonuclease P protein subunit RPR2
VQDGKKQLVRKIAEERIMILFGLAKESAGKDDRLMHRYVSELREIGSHYKIKAPKGVKNYICTGCNSVLVPGVNAKVRIVSSKGYVAYTCEGCKKERHIHY